MFPYQKRVIGELAELDERITNLANFLDSMPAAIDRVDANLLRTQLCIMQAYKNILNIRIENFKDTRED